MPAPSALTCPILIGRDEELRALVALLGPVIEGQGQAVCVVGEAGAGKSRIVRELISRAAERGFQTLSGNCGERDRDFPFGPFIDMFRQRMLTPGVDPRQFLGPHSEWLRELFPELSRLLGDVEREHTLTPEQRKRQQFEALVGVASHAASRQPLIIVLEDLHWADPTSLELIELLPRRLEASRALLIMTARSTEMDPRLRNVLASLRRTRSLIELRLEPLPDQAVDGMLDAMLPSGGAAPLRKLVIGRAGGNPFFVEELLTTIVPAGQGWITGDVPIPETVRASVLHRIDALPAEVRDIVNLLAIAGQHVDFDLLRVASGIDDDALEDAVIALRQSGLVVETTRPSRRVISFKHALTRDSILDGLTIAQRRPRHERIARAIEGLMASRSRYITSDADLGYHFHAARQWAKALDYARAAGDAAWSIHATFEALGHYRRSLDAALVLGHPDAAMLHVRCGQALDLLGSFEGARDHFMDALELAHGDQTIEQAALYELAGLYGSRDYRRAQEYAEQALDLARASSTPHREGLALNRLGNVLTNLEQFARGRSLHETALELFDAIGDRWGSADSHDLIGMAHYLSGEVSESRDACRRAAEMFNELDVPHRVASAMTTMGMYLAVIDGPCPTDAPPAAFREGALRGLEISRSIDWRSGEAYALVGLACADIGEGAYDSAMASIEMALGIAREIGHAQWTIIARIAYGILHADVFDHHGAREQFEQALDIAERNGFIQWQSRLRPWIARCHTMTGDLDTAQSMVSPVLPTGRLTSVSQRRALTTQAEIYLMMGQLDRALNLVDRLLKSVEANPPAAWLLLQGAALSRSERLDEAATAFRSAARIASAVGPRSVRWQAAAGLVNLSVIDAAERTSAQALVKSEIQELVAHLPDTLREHFIAAPEVTPWVAGPRKLARTRSAEDGLTRREREVAALVAQGLTNRQIAARLSIAEKTIEMHVSNSLGKLGFATRSQLAAWAVAKGLAPPPASD